MSGNRFKNFKIIWQKESNADNALYINIGADGPNDQPNENKVIYEIGQQQIVLLPKNNQKSSKYRNHGNKEFAKKNWCEAMRSYNQSLRFAEIGTENAALAYANRSACFFNRKNYEQCLNDIEFAKRANVPEKLQPKLDKRKEDCLKRIADGEHQIAFEPKLSFEPNEKYPSIANILEIRRDRIFGRCVTAMEDIDVGKTVLIEKSYVSKVMFDKDIRCNVCLRSDTNLISCKQCTAVLLCAGECENHFLHKLECGLKAYFEDVSDDGFMQIVRSILIAINSFPDVDHLIQFVEQVVAGGDAINILECEPSDALSKYRAFLELSFPPTMEEYELFNARIYTTYKTLLKQPDVAAMFSSKKHKRFLKHLIAHHESVIKCNCQSSFDLGGNTRTMNLLPLLASYFNHSCAPNVATFSYDGLHIAVVIRPIKRNEQLFISYLGLDVMTLSLGTMNRQKFLYKSHGFQCFCVRCIRQFITDENEDSSDPSQDECYNYVIKNYHMKLASVYDQEASKNLLEKCMEFMEKYGRKEWTDAMSLQMLCYVHMLSLTYKLRSNA